MNSLVESTTLLSVKMTTIIMARLIKVKMLIKMIKVSVGDVGGDGGGDGNGDSDSDGDNKNTEVDSDDKVKVTSMK
jgi:hypothetical protein